MISLPPRWRSSSDTDRGVLLTARSPVAGRSGVVPLVRLEVGPVRGPMNAWRERDLQATAARRADFELAEEDDYDLGGHEVSYRRFGFRRGDDEVVCEQWAWLVDGSGYTLTCTVGRGDYEDCCELFEAVASSFVPPTSPDRALSSRSATA
jgi:hypothetical protein